MRMKSKKSKSTPAGSVLSREELSSVLNTADALEKAAPSTVAMSDEILLKESTFEMTWIEKKGGDKLSPDLTHAVDAKIVETLAECMSRRLKARKEGVAIHELPFDSKQTALNKAAHEAEGKGLSLARDGVDEKEAVVKTVDPRQVLLMKPQDEPQRIQGDYLVSGSNVVGGPTQLPLFHDAMVDVIYFLHAAPYHQVRAKVPLGLAAVMNLKTRVRGEFIRAHPDDTHLSAAQQPEVYIPEGLAHRGG